MIRRCLSSVALALLIAPHAIAADAAATARDAVRAYLDDDIPALRALFADEGAADLRKAEIEADSRARVKCVVPAGTIINVISPNTVHATAGWWEGRRFQTKNLVIELAPRDGGWKVTKWGTRESLLAAQIEAAPKDADALLRDHPQLLTLELILQLVRRANERPSGRDHHADRRRQSDSVAPGPLDH